MNQRYGRPGALWKSLCWCWLGVSAFEATPEQQLFVPCSLPRHEFKPLGQEGRSSSGAELQSSEMQVADTESQNRILESFGQKKPLR